MRVWCLILLGLCTTALAQTLQFTEEFESSKSLVALQILNSRESSFDVLRYNKAAHDITVERRDKRSGGILWFRPLKLDSVNAGWFNYEDLDYLFFADNQFVYFVFEKAINTKKSVFIKRIDDNGVSSGFKELGFLDKDEQVQSFDFKIKYKKSELLLVGEQYYVGASSKKVVLLFDLQAWKPRWVKKLPLENNLTGFSSNYEWNPRGDLYYVMGSARENGVRRQYVNNTQQYKPIFAYDSLFVARLSHPENTLSAHKINNRDSMRVKSVSLVCDTSEVWFNCYYSDDKEDRYAKLFFKSQCYNRDLSQRTKDKETGLNPSIVQQLTFFDGGDYNGANEKEFSMLSSLKNDSCLISMAERKEPNYAKEILFWRTSTGDAAVRTQLLLPRKVFYFANRVRFKQVENTWSQLKGNTCYFFVLENRANASITPDKFSYHSFVMQPYLDGGTLTCYQVRENGKTEKQVLFKNGDYDYVPLAYQTLQPDVVFYFNKGKKEKFAILMLK